MTRRQAVDYFLLCAVWGASFLFMRLGAVEFGPLPTAALRVTIAAVFLIPLLAWKGQVGVLAANWKRVFAMGLLNCAIPFACFSYALLSISTGLSAILNATVPLFAAVIAWLWLGDRLNMSRVAGLVIGFAGVALLAADKAGFHAGTGGPSPGVAVAVCLLATLCYGLAATFTKRFLAGLPSLVTATGSQLGAIIGLAIPALWTWPAQVPSARAWGAMVALGVLCTGVAYILYFRLIEQTGPAKALTTTFVIPVFAIFYGVVLLGEPVTIRMLVCAAVILAGTSLSTGLVRLPRIRAA